MKGLVGGIKNSCYACSIDWDLAVLHQKSSYIHGKAKNDICKVVCLRNRYITKKLLSQNVDVCVLETLDTYASTHMPLSSVKPLLLCRKCHWIDQKKRPKENSDQC